jgi:hypothetical protein
LEARGGETNTNRGSRRIKQDGEVGDRHLIWERTRVEPLDSAVKPEDRYAVRHLERLPLGTPYMAVCDYLIKMYRRSDLTDTILAVDETGVGRPVVDLLDIKRTQADVRPITITGGTRSAPVNGWAGRWCCCKGAG